MLYYCPSTLYMFWSCSVSFSSKINDGPHSSYLLCLKYIYIFIFMDIIMQWLLVRHSNKKYVGLFKPKKAIWRCRILCLSMWLGMWLVDEECLVTEVNWCSCISFFRMYMRKVYGRQLLGSCKVSMPLCLLMVPPEGTWNFQN